MCNYVLSACSPADISAEHFEKIGVKYLCFNYRLGDKDYIDELGKTISYKDFYQAMRDGADTKTSLISVDVYADYFRSVLKEGKDIIPCFEKEYAVDGIEYMDVYIAIE